MLSSFNDYYEAIPETPEDDPGSNSFIRKVEREHVVISLDMNDNLQIIKNRFGGTNTLDAHQVKQLISKLVSNSIIGKKSILNFFKGSLEKEICDECEKIFKKWGIEEIKISADIEEKDFEDSFD